MTRPLLIAGLVAGLSFGSVHAQSGISIPKPKADPQRALALRFATFDPLSGEPAIPATLRGDTDTELWIVQFTGRPTDASRAAVRTAGGEIHTYLPHNSYVVRMPHSVAAAVDQLPAVRFVGQYHPAYRLEPVLIAEHLRGLNVPERRYNIVVVDKRSDKPALARHILDIGGEVVHEHLGSLLFEVSLDGAELIQAARLDEVLWIDRWTPIELDMDNARIQGGGDYVEAQGGYTGSGLNLHIYEGIEATHPDFTTPGTEVLSDTNGIDCPNPIPRHGHATAGIVLGNGTSHPDARGMAPDAVPFFTNYVVGCVNAGVSRWQVVEELVTNRDVVHTTASWGNARTFFYTSISADTDDIIFDHDVPWTQSQSNAGNPNSRPQAWAKNIFGIGGVGHGDNADRNDDSWRAGNGSTGPAADGRIKPDLCAYYNSIHTSDWTGPDGYTSGDSNPSFGGTSGATPIVAGHNALAIQMFTDHIFGNTPKVQGGTRFQNRPHATTLKAMMIANARQYTFTDASLDNRREDQGWGFPDLATMYDNRNRMLIVDEEDVLAQGQSTSYNVVVQAGDLELKVTMTFSDPAGSPAAALAAINDLSLQVTSPSGAVYHGNHGLETGNYSVEGGAPNTIDTVENVFVLDPEVGTWTVEVTATLIAMDSHVETPAVDADYALVATFGRRTAGISAYGEGCDGTQAVSGCPTLNPDGGVSRRSLRPNEYCYMVETDGPLTVSGFRVWTASTIGNANVDTAIYGDDGSLAPSQAALATSTMAVGSTEGWYETTFNPPVVIPSGRFFLGVDTSAETVFVINLELGDPGIGFFRGPGGSGPWATSSLVNTPAYQILCPNPPVASPPVLNITGDAALDTTVDIELEHTVAGAPLALLTGIFDDIWAGGTLPFDIGTLGATNCFLLTSTEITTGLTADGSGRAAFSYTVPNRIGLIGSDLYHQILAIDTNANTLGLVSTRAFHVHVGPNQ